ncbi:MULTISPECIES: branched-chain amino acid ABC transporter permease [Paraburkholderia]|uniref:ABC transporter permease subunit n=1 Tax=Paraburkholderia TaxID=1822464 RepID=UPI00225B67AF|nr:MULTISPECIES: branched-chain amino acid ABC transporter permease [Paraburkholderia]MCX4162316.1 branched-chain amino acid ABC transporter permease [Paraburkholderia megapolitana]MDN7157811.1 branched-chain amino acid ABC transporter permease [Paraburkholderia sp. CHISQ3]MDQ6494858.1 branched-chain amino acid ABC transporter permease [Paraburkholderia megapolitana]
MDLAAIVVIQVLYAIASLVVVSAGLAVIFGMMKVINLAHGEFMMLGAYAAIESIRFGVNLWVAILVVAPIVVGAIGIVLERLFIRRLYGRMVDTMLATWGLSLLLIGIVTSIAGNTTAGISAPLGNFSIGAYSVSTYTLVIIAVALVLAFALRWVLLHTSLGLIARGTMQNPQMADALGINPGVVYSTTFAIGAALSGLAGALLAPMTGVVPTMGGAFVAKAFITVIGGGPAIVIGLVSASTLFGAINQIATFATTPVMGEVALLIGAIIMLRLLPQGITGRFFKGTL